jgi:hypothetical protein
MDLVLSTQITRNKQQTDVLCLILLRQANVTFVCPTTPSSQQLCSDMKAQQIQLMADRRVTHRFPANHLPQEPTRQLDFNGGKKQA